jgi:hypothetical protein
VRPVHPRQVARRRPLAAGRDPATSPAACALFQTPRDPLSIYETIITWANNQG